MVASYPLLYQFTLMPHPPTARKHWDCCQGQRTPQKKNFPSCFFDCSEQLSSWYACVCSKWASNRSSFSFCSSPCLRGIAAFRGPAGLLETLSEMTQTVGIYCCPLSWWLQNVLFGWGTQQLYACHISLVISSADGLGCSSNWLHLWFTLTAGLASSG